MTPYSNPIILEDLSSICRRVNPSHFNGKTILVTGANSMLGKYIAMTFLHMASEGLADVRTIVLTRSIDKTRAIYADFLNSPHFGIIDSDVTASFDCDGPLDYIFHFAGNASPQAINSDPVGILRCNLTGTFNVMQLALEKKSKVIFASTREVYGASSLPSLDESSFGCLDPMDNRSAYPESKRAAETILRAYALQYGVKSISARIAHCYGPGMKLDSDGRVMSDFISDAVNGRDITLNSAGDAVSSFCYITDAVTALLILAEKGSWGSAYNLSNETQPIMVRDLAGLICDSRDDHKVTVRFNCETPAAGYCAYKRVALDNSRLAALGFTPLVSLEDGIKRTLKSFEIQNG